MKTKTLYQVQLNGKPQRFVNGPPGKRRTVDAGEGIDGPNEFSSEADADKRAVLWGLSGYTIEPVTRKVEKATNLREIGF